MWSKVYWLIRVCSAAGLMCKHGFTPVSKGLAEDWNTRFADEWVFLYRR